MGFEHNWNHTGVSEGEDLERGFFGVAGQKFNGEMGYQDYDRAMSEVIQNQPSRLPHFTQRMVERISNRYPALADKIVFYTAVGTPLDVYHGVDAFFKLQDHVVTLDVTSNSQKENDKADIVVYTGYDEDGGIDFSPEQIDRLAEQVGAQFAQKIKSNMH